MDLCGSQFELDYLEPRSRSNTLFSTKSALQHQSRNSISGLTDDGSEKHDNQEDAEEFKEQLKEDNANSLIGVDRGRAWFSVVGAFITAALIGGIERSFGVQTLFLQEYFNASPLTVSWVGALCTMLRFLCGTAAGLLCARYGCAKVTGCGALLFTIGIFISAFMPRVELLYLTYGIMPGVGGSMIYISASLMVNENFDRLRARANGIYLAGSGAGAFSMPIIIQYLHSSYGMRGEILLLSGISAHLLLSSGFFFLSTLVKKKPDPTQKSDIKISESADNDANSEISPNKDGKPGTFRKMINKLGCGTSSGDGPEVPLLGFILLISSIGFTFMGLIASIFGLPTLARERGVSPPNAALLVSLTGIWDMIGRSTSGLIFDKFVNWRKQMYVGCYLMLALVNFVLPSMSAFYQFVMLISFTGYFGGMVVAMRSVVCVEVVGKEALKVYFGFLVTAQGVGVLIGPPVASGLQSYFQDSQKSFYFCGAAQILSVILLSIDLILVKKAKNIAT